jgi:ribonuclease G
MKNQIIIHASGKQTRVALIENGELAQVFIDSEENQRTVGNIYLAEVHKVMGGIRAAFIRLNTAKDAFLHFSDVGEHLEDYIVMLNGADAIPKAARLSPEQRKEAEKSMSGFDKQDRAGQILQPGQKLLVQIVKEPIGSKGPRISTDITIAGRYLVLIPLGDYIAVSKRIRSFKERKRLRGLVQSLLPESYGVIIRTVAEDQDEEAIREDLRDVLDKWNGIITKYKDAQPPALLHRDLDMTDSLIRDLFAKDYDRVLIDDPRMHRSIKNYVSKIAPKMAPNIQLYKGSEHIFDAMKISSEIDSIFSPRVKMPSGGYLIFEQTEAMYVIDVNSGRYAAKKDQEENSLKTNLEAAREVAKQLRLRDIGGIIVVDFIDLKDEVNRKKVYDELKKEFRKDRAKTNVLPMSDFGLVQITRQRIRPSVIKSVSKVCPMCGGTGDVVSQNTLVSDISAWLNKFKHTYKYRNLDLYLNPYLRSFLTRGFINQIWRWMFKFGLKLNVITDDTLSMNDFKITLHGSDVDITTALINDEPIEKVIKETIDYLSTSRKQRPNLEIFDPEEEQQRQGYPQKRDHKPHRGQPHDGRRGGQDDPRQDPRREARQGQRDYRERDTRDRDTRDRDPRERDNRDRDNRDRDNRDRDYREREYRERDDRDREGRDRDGRGRDGQDREGRDRDRRPYSANKSYGEPKETTSAPTAVKASSDVPTDTPTFTSRPTPAGMSKYYRGESGDKTEKEAPAATANTADEAPKPKRARPPRRRQAESESKADTGITPETAANEPIEKPKARSSSRRSQTPRKKKSDSSTSDDQPQGAE